MPLSFAQDQPSLPPSQPGPINIHVDLDGLANLIWQSFIDHIGDVGTAVWTPLASTLTGTIRGGAQSVWSATFGAVGNIYGQLPPEWTYDNPAYRAIATDPLPVAVGGATLAIVLLGLRTLLGAVVGRDHVITHISGRLIPAVFLTLAYPVLVVRGVQLLNAASGAIGSRAAISAASSLFEFPALGSVAADLPLLVLWILLLWYGVRLLLRVAYSLLRFTVAL